MGSITSRKCSMCENRDAHDVANFHQDYVPLVRLQRFGTRISQVLRLCSACITEDAEWEVKELERKKARQ